MGHLGHNAGKYARLQQQIDRSVSGAPPSAHLTAILTLLFSPEEAEFAARIPMGLTPLGKLSRKMGVPKDELLGKLEDFARRGLVIDMEHQGRRWFALAPVAVGFFEFTFMRTRDNLPMAELARLFEEYLSREGRFLREACDGQTQIGRSLVHEEALPQDDHTEILDWERSTEIIKTASTVGVSLCACRHKAEHLDQACDRPARNCLSLNYAADSLIRNGMAERLTTGEAIKIIEDCKEAGLAQTGDNVQRKPTYICNCCGCCCEMMGAINTLGIRNAIVTSNWVAEIDRCDCVGCGKCVKACPINAITLVEKTNGEKSPSGKPRSEAVCDTTLCLGCGVCYSACKLGAIRLSARSHRVFTPETIFDRVVTMAIERGKLSELIFDQPERFSHRALARVVGALERTGAVKAALAIGPLRSVFFQGMLSGARKQMAPLSDVLE